MKSSARFIDSSTALTSNIPKPGTASANETDSNADACCLGNNFATLECTTKQVNVHACNTSIKPFLNVPVVSSAAAWDDPVSHQTHILVVNEALCCGTKSDHSPINPNQFEALVLIVGTTPSTKLGPFPLDQLIPA